MRKKSIAMAVPALFVAIVVSTGASARHISTLNGTFSRSQVKKDCSANGGAYIDWGKNGYSCYSTSGNGNVVDCNNRGKCTGSIPRQSKPSHTIGGISHPPSAGIKSLGIAPNGPWRPARSTGFRRPASEETSGNNRQPVLIMRNEGHHSGGNR